MQLYQNSQVRQPAGGYSLPADFFTARRLAPADFPALLCVPTNRQYEWRTQLPNIIDDLPLTVYAHRLYCHLKRFCGERNKKHCHENTKTLAAKTGMSTGKISDAKEELLRWGLVEIVPGSKRDGTSDEITIVDVWAINFDFYSQLAARKNSAISPEGVHQMNTPCSPDEPKKQTPPSSAQPYTDKKTTTQETEPGEMLPAANISGAAFSVVAPSPSANLKPIPDALIAALAGKVGSTGAALALLKAKRGDGLDPVDVCKQQLLWIADRPARDVGAVLADSIRGNWGEPTAAKRRREEIEKGELQKAKTVVQQTRADNEAKGKAARTAALMAYYAALPTDQRVAVDKAVAVELSTHRVYEKMPEPGRVALQQETREKILAQWKEGKTHA